MSKTGRILAVATLFATCCDGSELGVGRYPLATYAERVTVEFGSREDAQAAEARLMPLPPGKTIAFVTRWDASGDRAVEMAKCLVEAGAPGTFYPGECSGREDNDRLLKLGQSVGTYRATRGNMPGIAPEPQWETIMSYRIDVETALGTCVSTMALPYFSARDQNPDSGPRLGEAFLRAGYCGSSEPWDDDLNGTFGISPRRWVNVVGFPCWNEARPSQEDWARSAGAIERAQRPDCPCGPVVMLGVHPPQDAAARAAYVPILRKFVSNPEVWACGKPDYDAWRLEYLNGSVRKVSTDGATATFEVTRLEPWETGGKGGCALDFTRPAKNGPVVLGMTAPHVLPTLFRRVPGVLKWDPATHRASAAFTNDTGAALSDVVFTLRLPRAWTNGVRRLRVASLAAGAVQPLLWDLPIEREDPVYRGGSRFFALQVDAVRADRTRARWYMTTRETRPDERIAAPRDCGRWMGPCTNALGEAALRALSMPGAALRNVGDSDTYSRGEVWKDVLFRPMRVKSEVMFRGTDWTRSEQATEIIRATPHFVYSVFEFEADADGVCELVGGPNEMLGAVTPDRFRRFANGEGPEARNAPLKVRKGLNRILFAYSIKRDWTSFEMSLDVRPADGVREIRWRRVNHE